MSSFVTPEVAVASEVVCFHVFGGMKARAGGGECKERVLC